MSLRDEILRSPDLQHEDVDIPEWGTTLRVYQANAKQYATLITGLQKGSDDDAVALGIRFLTWLVRDPKTDELVFTEDDAAELEQKNPEALNRLTTVAYRLSGLFVTGEDRAKN